ncbi:hypothetical protein GLX30_12325 [Streptomyces sp. Tu 2975]|uniref:coiled-coil domain-containing protein n=1 Tax=Streptomyces sp. Tu 2975 TaxID=2676871 RepID=UPI00135C031C|nr:hypothetical protein [Streptomyces sp. Tu 2975]QIP84687.1 hypothetical protein GLX30_12325 [Streptomyces sp. Tu 2975]
MSVNRALRTVGVGALVVAALATSVPASAEGPGSDPRGAVDTVLGGLGDAVMEGFAGEAPPAAPGSPPLSLGELTAAPDVSGVLTRLRELYRQAEAAGETYRRTEGALRTQRAETARLNKALTKARGALVLSRAQAGRIAREQYQGASELSSYLELLLARDPQRALDQKHLIERAASGRLAAMARLKAGERRSEELAAAARKALEREVVLAARKKQARDRAAARLRSAEGLLASLSAEQLTVLATTPGTPPAPPRLPSRATADSAGEDDGSGGASVGGQDGSEAADSGQAPDTDAR